jgi:hypothetical protein
MMTARALKSVNRFAVVNPSQFQRIASPSMSFAVFMLIYVGIAIAFLAVAWRILRDLRRKRGDAAPKPRPAERERRAPKVTFPALRKAAAPEPQPEAPPPPRRRQLHSFAEAEKAASEPEMPPPASDAAAADASVADEANHPEALLHRLEIAFDRLQSGEITLEAYRTEVTAELAEIERRIATLGDDPQGAEMAAALAEQESARWCLEWADKQARPGA